MKNNGKKRKKVSTVHKNPKKTEKKNPKKNEKKSSKKTEKTKIFNKF